MMLEHRPRYDSILNKAWCGKQMPIRVTMPGWPTESCPECTAACDLELARLVAIARQRGDFL